jgi:hypothetical protein
MYLKLGMRGWYRFISLRYGPVCCCDHDAETSGCIRDREIADQLNDYQFLTVSAECRTVLTRHNSDLTTSHKLLTVLTF